MSVVTFPRHLPAKRSKHASVDETDADWQVYVARVGETDRRAQLPLDYASANGLRQQGHSPSYPFTRALKAVGCGSVMMDLNANGWAFGWWHRLSPLRAPGQEEIVPLGFENDLLIWNADRRLQDRRLTGSAQGRRRGPERVVLSIAYYDAHVPESSIEILGVESFLAVDEGILIKCGAEVSVSTWNAVLGSQLGELKQAVQEQFRELDVHERKARSALGRLEANLVRQVIEWEERGHA